MRSGEAYLISIPINFWSSHYENFHKIKLPLETSHPIQSGSLSPGLLYLSHIFISSWPLYIILITAGSPLMTYRTCNFHNPTSNPMILYLSYLSHLPAQQTIKFYNYLKEFHLQNSQNLGNCNQFNVHLSHSFISLLSVFHHLFPC